MLPPIYAAMPLPGLTTLPQGATPLYAALDKQSCTRAAAPPSQPSLLPLLLVHIAGAEHSPNPEVPLEVVAAMINMPADNAESRCRAAGARMMPGGPASASGGVSKLVSFPAMADLCPPVNLKVILPPHTPKILCCDYAVVLISYLHPCPVP